MPSESLLQETGPDWVGGGPHSVQVRVWNRDFLPANSLSITVAGLSADTLLATVSRPLLMTDRPTTTF